MRHILGVILCVLPMLARAASLDVDPIRVTFSAQNSIAVLTLTNAGDAPATVQLEPVAWSQDKGEDVYIPTRDLLATPPIFTVPAGSKQIIRLGLRVAPDAQRELSYRLYLQEVPQATKTQGLGVVMALRIGVPVFVEPAVAAKPAVQWTVKRLSDRTIELDAANSGNAHVLVHDITLTGPGKLSLAPQQAAYILPGKARAWILKLPRPLPADTALQLDCESDAGALRAKLVLQ
jgi:fimbrial chaperone protein